jgi:flagellar hook protein FlgE
MMSISGSLFIAGTALDAFSNAINVAGDNIANLNTVGFRTSQLEFADLLPTSDGQIENSHGVRLSDVSKPFQQGAFETTASVTDLALEGSGFFIVRDAANGTSYYTRAGQFHLDSAGMLVNDSELRLQGATGDITLGNALTVPAQATSTLNLVLSLDASSNTPVGAFPAGPDASSSDWMAGSNFSSVTTIYDAQGSAHDLTLLFRKTAPNTWEYRVAARRSELDAAAPTSAELRQVSAPGTLVFTANGQLDAGASTQPDINGLNWINGASQSIAAANLNLAGSVQYDRPSALLSGSQDGFAQGAFTGLTIDSQGVITGRFSNGTNQVLGTVTLANFANVDDLNAVGDTLFSPTLESGAAQAGAAGQNGFGNIISGALELSTVDLAREFVALITSQRAFQANSRIITTADQMYAVARDLKT